MTEGPVRQVVKRDGQVVAFDRDRITTAIFKAASSDDGGGEDRAAAGRLAAEVETALADSYGTRAAPTVEDIQDVVESTLIRRGCVDTAKAYIIYRHERARAREARAARVEASDNIPYRRIYEVLRWNMDHGCETAAGLNRIVAEGRLPWLIAESDARYDAEIRLAAELVLERGPDVRLVIIAGPSSSGKTTTTIKLGEHLRAAGRELVALNVDHYFFDLEMHPKDEFGDYDYETPQALDLPLINEHLEALLAGRTVRTPHYDFKTGKRTLDVHEMRLEPRQVLLIDSLHGLYDEMTKGVDAARKFRLYIETLGQLRNEEGVFMRWADNRLMRRMIRDSWHRNHAPLETITHWHYVRSSELKHIIPFIGSVDTVVNSALPYELPILKPKLHHYFPAAAAACRDNPARQDAYLRASRIAVLLDGIEGVENDSVVPARSLLREFIGGSEYRY